jgi:hypothetical protein
VKRRRAPAPPPLRISPAAPPDGAGARRSPLRTAQHLLPNPFHESLSRVGHQLGEALLVSCFWKSYASIFGNATSGDRSTRMRSPRHQPSSGLSYLPVSLLAAIAAERTRAESKLGHSICGRYLGGLDEHPNVCWRFPAHGGSHL